jgi:hypothetical protein
MYFVPRPISVECLLLEAAERAASLVASAPDHGGGAPVTRVLVEGGDQAAERRSRWQRCIELELC